MKSFLSKRPLRVLHVGNIANNAYYNAKFLRRVGVEADVLCYDNYWVMSSPEWEEADFDVPPADQFQPRWSEVNLRGYQRPRWFAQGPLDLCVAYLIAFREGRNQLSCKLWDQLTSSDETASTAKVISKLEGFSAFAGRHLPARIFEPLRLGSRTVLDHCTTLWRRLNRDPTLPLRNPLKEFRAHQDFWQTKKRLVDDFGRRFQDRPDKLSERDFDSYEQRVPLFSELFKCYDIVHAYATEPVLPLLVGTRPYVAFEHGTLRDAPEAEWAYKGPFQDSAVARLTALSYAMADHVFITNADCLESARRLGLQSFEAMPHPLDETGFAPSDAYREELRRQTGTRLVFFCPIRHDWVDKGTDLYIRALPLLRRAIGSDFRVCFTPWGREVSRSRRLIRDLGCEDLVMWVGPFGRVHFARWLSASDIVFDQLKYLSFSGLTPRALSCGVPVIASYDPSKSAWMFPEPAPVLDARTEDDIVSQVLVAKEPTFLEKYRPAARSWIERYHSSSVVTERLLRCYRSILRDRRGLDEVGYPE